MDKDEFTGKQINVAGYPLIAIFFVAVVIVAASISSLKVALIAGP